MGTGWGLKQVPTQGEHDIVVRGRQYIEISGVESVDSFDTKEFRLTTTGGPLQIYGSGLHMRQLDLQTGVVILEGNVVSFAYVPEDGKRRITGRLFR